MPRYHFHVFDGRDRQDAGGRDLANLQSARMEALVIAGGILRAAAERLDLGEEWRVEVTDEAGLALFRTEIMVVDTPAVQGWRSGSERAARSRPSRQYEEHRPTTGEAIQAARTILARRSDGQEQE